jgi:hypothetical protein
LKNVVRSQRVNNRNQGKLVALIGGIPKNLQFM